MTGQRDLLDEKNTAPDPLRWLARRVVGTHELLMIHHGHLAAARAQCCAAVAASKHPSASLLVEFTPAAECFDAWAEAETQRDHPTRRALRWVWPARLLGDGEPDA